MRGNFSFYTAEKKKNSEQCQEFTMFSFPWAMLWVSFFSLESSTDIGLIMDV